MSFDFGVGDILAIISLANKIRKEFVDAPIQFKTISDEVRALSFAVQDVEIISSTKGLSTGQQDELDTIASTCRSTLTDIEKKIEKYTELEGSQDTKRKIAKRIWKRLTWEPNDINELRGRIRNNIVLLNAFYGKTSQNNVSKLLQHQENEDREKILHWLSPTNYAARYSDFIRRRQKDTGKWLLESSEFQKWIMGPKKTLFCPGMPGAGKTILSSIVIEELYREYENDMDVRVAYVYCNFQLQKEQTLEHFLESLLKQFAKGHGSLPHSVEALYNQHQHKGTRPTSDELSKALHSICAFGVFTTSFIVIDALDECQSSCGTRSRLIDEIFELQKKHNVNFLVTSRFIPEITDRFDGTAQLEIRASEQDVMKYLRGNLSLLPSCVTRSPGLQDVICVNIASAVSGMFLLAQLYLNSLIGKRSIRAIRSALKDLSVGQQTYDRAYDDAMDRIEHQATDQIELAKQTLAWIVCAKRQLTSQELQHALAVEPEESHFDEDNIPDLADIISACAGLVTVDQESEVIRLVHHTTQDYFQRNHSKWFPDAEKSITIASVSYLLLDFFEEGFCATDEDFNVRLARFPLCLYAAKNWGFHAREAMSENSESPMSEDLIMKLFADSPKLDFAVQILWSVQLDLNFIHFSQHPPRDATGLHLASWFGTDDLALRLIQRGYPVDARDSKGRTPLSWAAQRGNTSMAALLIRNGAIGDSKDTIGQTPLSFATWTGHERMVQVLLEENCDPNCKDRQHQTPLHHAADRGYERIAGYLLKHGANPNAGNSSGETPLLIASIYEQLPIVILLLDHGAFPEGKDQRGVTSLMAAASVVNEEIVRILHKRGGQIDTKRNNGQTALSQVARFGTEEMARLLVSLGANVSIKDNSGRTAISLAAESGGIGVIQQLLHAGGDPEVEDEYGRTSLIQAAANGNTVVVDLLSKLTNPNKGDLFGRTALHAAASGGHFESVRALLATDGIDHTPRDIFGSTPLSDAIKRSRHDVVSLLQEPTTAVVDAISQEPPSHREPPRAGKWCDVCIGFIGDFDWSYHCSACAGGNFDVCEICVQCGAHCLDSSHQLDKCQGIADD